MDRPVYIEFKEVTFAYGNRLVLRGVNFTVPEGTFVGVLGGSGSGKTTLLKLLSGQIFPQGGEILIKGKATASFTAREMYEHRKSMGYLFQQGALFTDLNVYDNVAFPLREHRSLRSSEIHQKVKSTLDLVGLTSAAELYPIQLSGGMIKRVALARAIILEPSLLLYDEPFSGLDPITLLKIANLISETSQKINATSVMVTHNIRESLRFIDKAILLADKTVVFEGSCMEMVQNRHPLVQDFLDAAGMGPNGEGQDGRI